MVRNTAAHRNGVAGPPAYPSTAVKAPRLCQAESNEESHALNACGDSSLVQTAIASISGTISNRYPVEWPARGSAAKGTAATVPDSLETPQSEMS